MTQTLCETRDEYERQRRTHEETLQAKCVRVCCDDNDAFRTVAIFYLSINSYSPLLSVSHSPTLFKLFHS